MHDELCHCLPSSRPIEDAPAAVAGSNIHTLDTWQPAAATPCITCRVELSLALAATAKLRCNIMLINMLRQECPQGFRLNQAVSLSDLEASRAACEQAGF
eukprot:GHRQ01026404.1.p1 GENE.GHRQ01026404.1~~GHRQ01026404.1.p1  ORF type:complete len:100 (-),score=18.32 GHRQ01026404.1:416-715(-)